MSAAGSEFVALNAAIKKYFGSPSAKQAVSKCVETAVRAAEAPAATAKSFAVPKFSDPTLLSGGGMLLAAKAPSSAYPPGMFRSPSPSTAPQMHMFSGSAISSPSKGAPRS